MKTLSYIEVADVLSKAAWENYMKSDYRVEQCGGFYGGGFYKVVTTSGVAISPVMTASELECFFTED